MFLGVVAVVSRDLLCFFPSIAFLISPSKVHQPLRRRHRASINIMMPFARSSPIHWFQELGHSFFSESCD